VSGLLLGTFFVYFDTQFISFREHATPHEHVRLLKHNNPNLPLLWVERQMLFIPVVFVQFSFKAKFDVVRAFDSQ